MKAIKKRIVISIICVAAIAIVYPLIGFTYWSVLAIGASPKIASDIRTNLEKLPSSQLIRKAQNFCNPYSFFYYSPYQLISIEILVDRREKEAIPMFISFLKCKDINRKKTAIWALGAFKDARAIEHLMDIIKDGEKNPNYVNALMALSDMQYEGAFPYVVERAKKGDAYRNGSIGMLKAFGKSECIPILLDIKNRIKDTDPMAKYGRSRVDDAIAHIKALQTK